MRDRLLAQTKREYGPRQRLALLAAAAVLFVVILPLALLRLGGRLDRLLDWPVFFHPPANAIVGGLMILAGWLLAMWTIYVQFTLGRGTPVPVMATHKLLICPPYSFCRNPMALGAIVLYLGVSVAAGSPGAALLVLLGAAALLTYIKIAEEREMVARFGEEYLAYRRSVPFLIPRLRWRRRKE
jgi:protein-S-isoprenylcysteine O-methyltransferase Ste14